MRDLTNIFSTHTGAAFAESEEDPGTYAVMISVALIRLRPVKFQSRLEGGGLTLDEGVEAARKKDKGTSSEG